MPCPNRLRARLRDHATILAALACLGSLNVAQGQSTLTVIERPGLLPPVPLFWGTHGLSVAACGDLSIVGAPELDEFFPSSAGRAHVYDRDGSSFDLVGTLTPSDGAPNDAFGNSVTVGRGSSSVAVGAPNSSITGAAYVFAESGAGWVELQKLVPSDLTDEARFGHAVDMDMESLVVGAPFDPSVDQAAGSVYVFEGGQQDKLLASDAQAQQLFGWSVAIDRQVGPRIVVGAPRANAGAGAVYVFIKTGAVWVEEARLAPLGLGPLDDFGWSVDIHGERIVVGAPEYDGATPGRGLAFVFDHDGTNWVEQPELAAPGGTPGDAFGSSVSLGRDLLIVGSPTQVSTGSVHAYERGSGGWFQAREITASAGLQGDFLGSSVALAGDWLLAGAYGVDDGTQQQSGAAYPFELGKAFASPFCFGDGSGAPCPCANESRAGGGDGCRAKGEGSRLRAFGSNGVGVDDMVILGDFGRTTTALLFAGRTALGGGNGQPFGGGLRCVGGALRRLGVRNSASCGQTEWGPGLAGIAGWNPGDVIQFQAWARADVSGCGSGFALTSAIEVTFAP